MRRITPHKTPLEKELNAEYMPFLSMDGVIPQFIVDKFLNDKKKVVKYSKR